MAYSYVQYTGNNATTNFAFSFPYLDSSHIKVRVDGVITPFTFVNSGTIQISPAPLAGKIIDIRRETPKDIAPVNFTDGSVLLEQDLDLLAAFNLYTAQESADGVADAIVKDSTGVWDAQSRRIKDVANPVNANDAVNKNWAETAMSSQLASATAQATISTTKAGEAAASASSASTSASTATTKAGEAAASATSASNSATSATASAATATTKASEALASQVAAAASASTASTKASEANTSAGNAAGSASTAATQAGIATTKATEASNSASAAATSASTATTKADSATASATSAASSAATATTKAAEASSDATSAATSASNAASSATSAANQVALATTQANNSASSASASAASASDSANSATSAAASAASAAAILDNFDDRYLGSKSSAPTVDNDGNALLLGALYFDSTTGKMRVYTASGWIDASSASVATLGTFKFTATGGQTSFSGTGDTGIALSYTVGAVIVSLNGVLLEEGSEFTASTGSSIVLASGASAGDELNVYAFGNFLVADTYSRAEADSKYVGLTGNQSIAGNKNFAGNTLYVDDTNDRVGVGTSSPASLLHLSSGLPILTFTDTNDSATSRIYQDDSVFAIDVDNLDTKASSALQFRVDNTTRMNIDNAGRVTTPNQPAFRINRTSSFITSANVPYEVVFNASVFDNNSNYNTSTGRFTAPVTGAYYFTAALQPTSSSFGVTQHFYVNGSAIPYASVGWSSMPARGDIIISAVIKLTAGDYISVYVTTSNNMLYDNNGQFSGFLLG